MFVGESWWSCGVSALGEKSDLVGFERAVKPGWQVGMTLYLGGFGIDARKKRSLVIQYQSYCGATETHLETQGPLISKTPAHQHNIQCGMRTFEGGGTLLWLP